MTPELAVIAVIVTAICLVGVAVAMPRRRTPTSSTMIEIVQTCPEHGWRSTTSGTDEKIVEMGADHALAAHRFHAHRAERWAESEGVEVTPTG